MKIQSLTEELIRDNWPVDVPFNAALCEAIRLEWIAMKMNERECVATFIRNRVPTRCRGEYAIPGNVDTSSFDVSAVSVGPFSHGTGGGVRNVRKAENMS